MCHGLPVVAFDAGGIREWLFDGENGFLVPWKDTDRFAERIEQLLRDKELARRLGRRGQGISKSTTRILVTICPVEQVLAPGRPPARADKPATLMKHKISLFCCCAAAPWRETRSCALC